MRPTRKCLALSCAWLFIACYLTLAGRVALAAQWADQRKAGPFLCRANFSLAGYEPLLGELAGVQVALSQSLGLPPAREGAEMYLFDSQRAYRHHLETYYPQVPYRRALFIKGRGPGRVYVFRSSEMAVDMRHEGTHALLHAVLPVVPLWLDEGLAEYFELPPEQRMAGPSHRRRLNWKLLLGRPPRLTNLEAKRELADMTEADYSDSWAWVHFMLHGPPEAHDELVRFIADIRNSTPPGLLSERLARRLPDLDEQFIRHFRTYVR